MGTRPGIVLAAGGGLLVAGAELSIGSEPSERAGRQLVISMRWRRRPRQPRYTTPPQGRLGHKTRSRAQPSRRINHASPVRSQQQVSGGQLAGRTLIDHAAAPAARRPGRLSATNSAGGRRVGSRPVRLARLTWRVARGGPARRVCSQPPQRGATKRAGNANTHGTRRVCWLLWLWLWLLLACGIRAKLEDQHWRARV